MDHILLLEHQYSRLKHCNPGVARFRRSVTALQAVFVFSAIGSLALFLSLSMHISPSSTVSARLLAVGSLVITKKALFLLSNFIFLFLAADYCRFFTVGASTSDVAACEPGDGLAEQAQHHQGAEQCATQSFVSYSVGSGLRHKTQSSPLDNCIHLVKDNHAGIRADVRMSDNTIPLERHEEQDVPVLPTLELFKLDDDDEEEEADNVTLETVVIEEQGPTCRTAQELERLDIDELNKKFEEFIQSRRIKWVEEQGYLKCQEKGDNTSGLLLAC
ncbi:hypothetical protein QOZ80_3BG0271980 [Eleusine coracana subsp. coracana]|nr:hypothetical protein QOZ80_3BG0271980 [Eleusine coracana subsp. coracana]